MDTQPHNAIADHGYRISPVQEFLATAPKGHVDRYLKTCAGNGDFVLWDPHDDADGFMVCAETVAELNAEFIEHFGDEIVLAA